MSVFPPAFLTRPEKVASATRGLSSAAGVPTPFDPGLCRCKGSPPQGRWEDLPPSSSLAYLSDAWTARPPGSPLPAGISSPTGGGH